MTYDLTLYDHEPWAHLARMAGFEPIDTESAARSAFRFFAYMSDAELLAAISKAREAAFEARVKRAGVEA